MENILDNREERIKIFLDKGYTGDIITGKVLDSRGSECKSLKDVYIRLGTTFDKKRIQLYAHQLIYYISIGEVVKQIDHINGDRTDNRIENLRSVTNQENQHNQTKAKGYTWNKTNKKWKAQITVNGEIIYLKCWNTEQEARQAYLDVKKEYHIL